ncbi:hypothetical protein [Chryseobacterium sp.]|uniref:hypothetical protein n=1 Tax=Chryseobacterium sp. TaxID=1871047 RepID=UPI0028419406|nr:hypothetical protein [Chryseobacterium sp.]MDR3025943.1 hypothetical protein [Chryseobacterium sp.]
MANINKFLILVFIILYTYSFSQKRFMTQMELTYINDEINQKYSIKYNKDSLNIFFENDFKNDKIKIFSDRKIIFQDKITTDKNTNHAKFIAIPKNLNAMVLKINNSEYKIQESVKGFKYMYIYNNEDDKFYHVALTNNIRID